MKLIKEEEFRDVIGYEGHYQISNFGKIKSLARLDASGHQRKEKMLKRVINDVGYMQVNLYKDSKKKTRSIHQLVAEAFLNHKPCGMKLVINHIDFNKINNNVNNLEIVSSRENGNRKHIKSSSQYTGVAWRKCAKKWQSLIRINSKLHHLGSFTDEKEAGDTYQIALKLHLEEIDIKTIKEIIKNGLYTLKVA